MEGKSANVHEEVGKFVCNFSIFLHILSEQIGHYSQQDTVVIDRYLREARGKIPFKKLKEANPRMGAADLILNKLEAKQIIDCFIELSQAHFSKPPRSGVPMLQKLSEKWHQLRDLRNDILHGAVAPDEHDQKEGHLVRYKYARDNITLEKALPGRTDLDSLSQGIWRTDIVCAQIIRNCFDERASLDEGLAMNSDGSVRPIKIPRLPRGLYIGS